MNLLLTENGNKVVKIIYIYDEDYYLSTTQSDVDDYFHHFSFVSSLSATVESFQKCHLRKPHLSLEILNKVISLLKIL